MSVIIDLGCIGRPTGSVVRQIGRRGTIIEIDIIPLRPDHLPVIIDLGLLGISVVRQIGRRGTIIEINILPLVEPLYQAQTTCPLSLIWAGVNM